MCCLCRTTVIGHYVGLPRFGSPCNSKTLHPYAHTETRKHTRTFFPHTSSHVHNLTHTHTFSSTHTHKRKHEQTRKCSPLSSQPPVLWSCLREACQNVCGVNLARFDPRKDAMQKKWGIMIVIKESWHSCVHVCVCVRDCEHAHTKICVSGCT